MAQPCLAASKTIMNLFPRTRVLSRMFLIALAVVPCASPLLSTHTCEAKTALESSEETLGRSLKNYRLVDQDGQSWAFNSFRGNVVLLMFMYTHCPGPCMMITASVKEVLDTLDESLADDVMTISMTIDPDNDKPGVLKEFGREFTDSFERWKFVVADERTMAQMVGDLGFRYEKTSDGMEHMNRLTLIGPEGKVAQHFYGTDYDPAIVADAIKSTMEGRPVKSMLSGLLDKALIYCSNYDLATNTYKVDFMFIFAVIIQFLLITGTVLFIFREKIGSYFSNLFKRGVRRVS